MFYEDKTNPASLKQIQRLHEHDGFFGEFFNGKPKALAQELLGETVIGKNLQYFDKPSPTSLPTPAHQDGAYFAIMPNHAVTLWIPLDDVGGEQGCLSYVPGSHRRHPEGSRASPHGWA